MVSWVLLLIVFLLSVYICAGTFVLNVSQSHYQAQENENITLEWRFNPSPDGVLFIVCDVYTDHGDAKTLLHLHRGEEQPDSQDEQFLGRVQCERNVLSKGRMKIHLSRVRLNDSGVYVCEVHTSHDVNLAQCHVDVSAATDWPKAQTPTQRPRPEYQGMVGVYITLALVLSVAVVTLASLGAVVIHKCSTYQVKHSVEKNSPECETLSDSLTFNSTRLLLPPC